MLAITTSNSKIHLRVRFLALLLVGIFIVTIWFVGRSYQLAYEITYNLLDARLAAVMERSNNTLNTIEDDLQTAAWQVSSGAEGFDLSLLSQALKLRKLNALPIINALAWSSTDGNIVKVPGFNSCNDYEVESLLDAAAANRGKLQFGVRQTCNNTSGIIAAFAVSSKEGIYLGSLLLHLNLELFNTEQPLTKDNVYYTILSKETVPMAVMLAKMGVANHIRNQIDTYILNPPTKPLILIEPLSNLLHNQQNIIVSPFRDYPLFIAVLSQDILLPELILGIRVMMSDIILILVMIFGMSYFTRKWVLMPIAELAKSTKMVADEQGGRSTSSYGIAEYDIVAQGICHIASQREDLQAEQDKRGFLLSQLKTETEAQAEFIRNLQHELRTPLHHIITGSEIMLNMHKEEGEQREYLNMIHQAGNHLLRLGNEMMAAANIESGRASLNQEYCAVDALLLHVIDRVKSKASKQKIQISYNFPPDLPQALVDRAYFSDALFYIMENGIQFGKADGILHAAVKRIASGLVIEISDDGYGISSERLAKIHSAFEGTQSVLRKAQEGIGLGLVIAHSILQMHDIKLQIESTEGSGTTVQITIPNIRVKANTNN